MGRMPWPAYLWPGLPDVCRDGRWAALGLAVGFGALVDLALVASLLWSELFAAGVRNSVWVAVAVLWIGSAVFSYRRDSRCFARAEVRSSQDAFAEAVERYLQGDWYESERALRRMLQRNVRDVDARLMLATLLRRTGRPTEAEEQLARLERFSGSEKWEVEIRRERRLLSAPWEEEAQEADAGARAAEGDPPGEMAEAA